MRLLGISPGPDVGRAYRYLLELRLDHGPLGEEEASRRLLEWWRSSAQGESSPAAEDTGATRTDARE